MTFITLCSPAGCSFWPLNDGTDDERLEVNDPPLLPDYEEEDEEIDVVGVDDEDVLQLAEPQGADGEGEKVFTGLTSSTAGEERKN